MKNRLIKRVWKFEETGPLVKYVKSSPLMLRACWDFQV